MINHWCYTSFSSLLEGEPERAEMRRVSETARTYDVSREFVVLADDMEKGCFVHVKLPLDKSLITGFD